MSYAYVLYRQEYDGVEIEGIFDSEHQALDWYEKEYGESPDDVEGLRVERTAVHWDWAE